MYGSGILKGMAVTIKHFVNTYREDLAWYFKGGRYYNDEALKVRQSLKGTGAITVNYPEEKLPVPERFRFVPFLVSDDPAPGQQWGHDWCTSCGICAKVCPPSASGSSAGRCRMGDRSRNRKSFTLTLTFA